MTGTIRLLLLGLVLAVVGCSTTHMASQGSLPGSVPTEQEGGDFDAPAGEEADVDVLEALPDAEALSADAPLTPDEETILDTEVSISVDLDTEENTDVQRYFYYFTHTHRKTFEAWLQRAAPYLPQIRKRLLEEGLPEDLVCLPFAESGYNPFAYSRAGAAGIWQFMPRTGRNFGLHVDSWVDERRDPSKATEAAIAYLKKLYTYFGDWSLALAAYNAGEGKIGRELKATGCEDYFSLCEASSALREETKLYVPKFMAIVKIIRNLEQLGFAPIDWEATGPSLALIHLKPRTDLLALAKSLGMTWKQFRELNPVLRKQAAPPSRGLDVNIPITLLAKAEVFLKNPVLAPKPVQYRTYVVKSGDSWWSVSKRYGLSVAQLRKANSVRNLRPGQKLRVPGRGGETLVADKSEAEVSSSRRTEYTVRPGDSWWSIASKHKTTVKELQKRNTVAALRPGQVLRISGRENAGGQEKTRRWAEQRSNYVVRQGDTLWGIAKNFQTNAATLLAANGMKKGDTLRVGQRVYIPDAGRAAAQESQAKSEAARRELVRYRIRRGDSLWSIAKKFGVTPSELRSWNKLAKNSVIRPGVQLKVFIQ